MGQDDLRGQADSGPAPPPAPIPRPLLGLPEAVLAAFIRQWRREGREWEMVAEGSCMEPALRAGDVLRVAAGVESVKVGDIILTRHRGRLCAHRVVKIDCEDGVRVFTTKGDRNQDVDRPRVGERLVLGRVVACRRQGGTVFRPPDAGDAGGEVSGDGR